MSLVPRHVEPKEWKPAGIKELELNALLVVRSTNNRSVIVNSRTVASRAKAISAAG